MLVTPPHFISFQLICGVLPVSSKTFHRKVGLSVPLSVSRETQVPTTPMAQLHPPYVVEAAAIAVRERSEDSKK